MAEKSNTPTIGNKHNRDRIFLLQIFCNADISYMVNLEATHQDSVYNFMVAKNDIGH